MNSSHHTPISDELLSAYIDSAVTESERMLVEAAAAADPDVSWRLKSLSHTVNLLNNLPAPPLPRSFVLQSSQVFGMAKDQLSADAGHAPIPTWTQRSVQARQSRGVLNELRLQWIDFWHNGNSFLRNAAAASLALFVVLLLGDLMTASPAQMSSAMHSETAQLLRSNELDSGEVSEAQPDPAAANMVMNETSDDAQDPEVASNLPTEQNFRADLQIAGKDAATSGEEALTAERSVAFALPTVTPRPEVVATAQAAEVAPVIAPEETMAPSSQQVDLPETVASTTSNAQTTDAATAFDADELAPVSRLQLSQIAAGILTFILIVLWWYSRSVYVQSRRHSPLHR